ncbi:YxeA family protein [Exiguobacterium sp. SL-10]|uniref:YxeA family protein n=1 Tax=unclassified Exiguobacterium TaxID=2644629 RepID=UPI00103A991A|nr:MULTISPECIES: YxeA family protein [unclassified Exiguobacterium]TCI21553.1 YxeA family protein [Exiguobacterium sp. SL-9]TCI28285.1 YxeA family protein [Exiguobacterium sp. SL-10]
MKRIVKISGVVLILLLGGLLVDTDRLFADIYYTKVPSRNVTDQGTTYTYEMIGYDEEGKKRPITLRAPTRLAEGDFLKVYIKDEGKVTAYESVVESEVPAQLKDEQTDEPVSIPLP